mmetsp:Transcript_63137/g.150524  ORF Transcript_63137/g.150524 Transcript_63137/m.150524 type:complete len:216 (+) Transcript_63137:122-769(+)
MMYDNCFDQDTVEVVIDDLNVKKFSRRSKRRLRDLQRTSEVTMELNRLRGVLRIKGSRDNVSEVQSKLVDIGGFHRQVPVAMWAELLRTRMDSYDEEAPMTLAWIQHHSGCRVHIERSKFEVRLFGSSEDLQRAVVLMDAVAKEAAQILVRCPEAKLSEEVIQELGQAYGVTLQWQEEHVLVLGRRLAVLEAACQLKALQDAPNPCELPLPRLWS